MYGASSAMSCRLGPPQVCTTFCASVFLAAGCYLGIVWMSYFDDFPMLSHSLHVGSTLACAKGLMSLLVLVYSEEKLQPFECSTEILGVVFDLSRSGEGCVSISNKPSRVDELNEALVKIMKGKFVIPTSMPSVLGKLQCADSHVWGRVGASGSRGPAGAGPHFSIESASR